MYNTTAEKRTTTATSIGFRYRLFFARLSERPHSAKTLKVGVQLLHFKMNHLCVHVCLVRIFQKNAYDSKQPSSKQNHFGLFSDGLRGSLTYDNSYQVRNSFQRADITLLRTELSVYKVYVQVLQENLQMQFHLRYQWSRHRCEQNVSVSIVVGVEF